MVPEHGQDDIAAPAGETDDCCVVAFAFSPFPVVKGFGLRAPQRGESGQEHGVLQAVVATPALSLAIDGLAGLTSDGGQAGIGGQVVAVNEPLTVAYFGQDTRPVRGPIPGMLESSSPKG